MIASAAVWRGDMKLVAASVTLLFVSLGARLEARDLPRPASLVDRAKASNPTHYVRGAERRLPAPAGLRSRDRHWFSRPSHGVRGK